MMAYVTAFSISDETEEALRMQPMKGLLRDFVRANDLAVLYKDKSINQEWTIGSLKSKLEQATRERDDARAVADGLRADIAAKRCPDAGGRQDG